MTTEPRPDRTTMEGMIWNANHVLESALKPGVNGIPSGLFEQCKGIVLISVVEVGFFISGSLGTGIVLAKKKKNSDGTTTWSNPSACGLAGVGWGLLAGGSIKDLIIFCMDDVSLAGASSSAGVKVGGQAEVTLGPFGRTVQLNVGVGTQGASGTVAVAYSAGAFMGLSLESAVVGSRDAINYYFYGKNVTPHEILFDDNNAIEIPAGQVTLIDEVYAKLAKLAEEKKPAASENQLVAAVGKQ